MCAREARNLEKGMMEKMDAGRAEALQFLAANDNLRLITADVNLRLMLITERR